MPDELTRALRRLAPPRVGREASPEPAPLPEGPGSPFEAALATRLRSVEADLAEVRGRVNGLLFVVAGFAITQSAMRLLA